MPRYSLLDFDLVWFVLVRRPVSEREKKRSKTRTTIICSVLLCTTLIICAAIVATVVQRRKVLRSKEEADVSLEIERKDVVIKTELGKGCFGIVYKGTLNDSRQVY